MSALDKKNIAIMILTILGKIIDYVINNLGGLDEAQ